MNHRITARERGLLKGSMRRVFARSELRQRVLNASVVKHSDPTRPKVKTWCRCADCGELEAKSYCVVDHIEPVIKIDTSFDEMGLDKTADRMWCDESNLQVLDKRCHEIKSKAEAKLRRANKKLVK